MARSDGGLLGPRVRPPGLVEGLGVGRVVVIGTEEGVDELGRSRAVHVGGVHGREVVDEGAAELEVGAQAWSVSSRSRGLRSRSAVVTGSAAVVLASADFFSLATAAPLASSSSWVRLIGPLDELPVERAVDGDRPAALELDQDVSGAPGRRRGR
jgi:hypothetical protein